LRPLEEFQVTRMDRIVRMGVRSARRVVIGVVGLTAVLVGIALLVLPGPAFLVIPIGLGILAIEFEWARRLLRRARRLYDERLAKPPSR
jgi:tellurite resistance protein TerC